MLDVVVKTYGGMEYPEFYELMQSMDVTLPAFAEDSCQFVLPLFLALACAGTHTDLAPSLADYETRASSTWGMTLQVNVRSPNLTHVFSHAI